VGTELSRSAGGGERSTFAPTRQPSNQRAEEAASSTRAGASGFTGFPSLRSRAIRFAAWRRASSST
jgi:hypothetical protein